MERLEEDIRERFLPTLRETEHDRVAAGLALGLALLFYDTHTHGEGLLREMLEDSKPYVRMAGVLGLGLAYVGQHARHAVVAEWASRLRVTRSLLRIIAGDVSDCVRRNAVIALGFVFADAPAAFTSTALLLLQSYNPHIRYATALVSGLIGAGSAEPRLGEALLKLMDDSVGGTSWLRRRRTSWRRAPPSGSARCSWSATRRATSRSASTARR